MDRFPLPDDLAALLAAQEEFDALRAQWARGPGRRGTDLAYANPYGGAPEEVRRVLADALQPRRTLDLQYTPYGGGTIPRRRVAETLREAHGQHYAWQDVILTPGAMAALQITLRAIALDEPGAEVVVPTPCWLDHPLYVAERGLRMVPVPVREDDHRPDPEAIAEACGPRTRALLLTQPGNPTGTVLHPDELKALARVLERASADAGVPVLLIADECHRDFVIGEEGCPSPARHYPHTVTVYSFGKRHFIQGQRLGYAAVSPRMGGGETLRRRLEQLCRVMGFCTPTALMQAALPRLLELAPAATGLDALRRRVADFLRSAGYRLVEPDGGLFLYPAVPEGAGDDFAFCRALAERGVLVLPSRVFHGTGHVRLSLTDTEDAVERALPVFAEFTRG